MKDLFKLALLMGSGVAVVWVLSAAEKARPREQGVDLARVPGFLDLMRCCYGGLLDPANAGRSYAVDPARKLHCVLEEPVEDEIFKGFTRPRFAGELPRIVCADGDDTVPDSLRRSARDAFVLAAEQVLRALEARPHVMAFYHSHPGAHGHMTARIVPRHPSLN